MFFININAKYTEDDMRKCFEQSRLKHPMAWFKHDTFEDYIKTVYVTHKTNDRPEAYGKREWKQW